MLKQVSKALNGEMLKVLWEMGHGDIVIIADANFPAQRLGKRMISCDYEDLTDVLDGILSVFPVDHCIGNVTLMHDQDYNLSASWSHYQELLENNQTEIKLQTLNRRDFYDFAKEAELIILTKDKTPFGNIGLMKGCL